MNDIELSKLSYYNCRRNCLYKNCLYINKSKYLLVYN